VTNFATERQPRGINIDPSGQYLVASGEKSDRLPVYRIDSGEWKARRRDALSGGLGRELDRDRRGEVRGCSLTVVSIAAVHESACGRYYCKSPRRLARWAKTGNNRNQTAGFVNQYFLFISKFLIHIKFGKNVLRSRLKNLFATVSTLSGHSATAV